MTGCVLGFNICVSTARICNYDHMVGIDVCKFDDKKLQLAFRRQLGRQICKNLFSNEFLCTKNLIWFDSIVCTVALSSVFFLIKKLQLVFRWQLGRQTCRLGCSSNGICCSKKHMRLKTFKSRRSVYARKQDRYLPVQTCFVKVFVLMKASVELHQLSSATISSVFARTCSATNFFVRKI